MKDAFLAQLRADRVIGLVDALPADELIACARALTAGGLHCLELAMTTPTVIQALEAASTELPEFHFGLGTVLDVETARLGLLAGARFIVTPAPRPAVITLCRRFNAPVISGVFSRADIVAAHHAGADAVSILPGELSGPAQLRALHRDAPELPLIPIGGVTPETITDFLHAGATAVVAGSSLLHREHVGLKRWDEVKRRAAAFRAAASGFRAAA